MELDVKSASKSAVPCTADSLIRIRFAKGVEIQNKQSRASAPGLFFSKAN